MQGLVLAIAATAFAVSVVNLVRARRAYRRTLNDIRNPET